MKNIVVISGSCNAMSEPAYNGVDVDIVTKFLKRYPGVRFIRLQWLDYCCTLRARVLTANHFLNLTTKGRFHEVGRGFLSLPDDSGPLYDGAPSLVVGKNILLPDLSSLRLCPWVKNHASIMCFYSEQYENPADTEGLRPVISDLCPRGVLRKALLNANQFGLNFHIGMEIEFVVFIKDPEGSLALDLHHPHQASSIRTIEGRMQPILDEIVQMLEMVDISVQHYQSEAGDGQFELALSPMAPMLAADAIIFTREVIRNICAKHSMIATVHPMCTTHSSGAHTHLSIDGALSEDVENHFLAGVLDHLRGLCAIGMLLPPSYDRVVSGKCAAGRLLAWGTQNRETAIRKLGKAWWELRIADGLANVYLFLASVILAGCSGVKLRSLLSVNDCQGKNQLDYRISAFDIAPVDPDSLSKDELAACGIVQLLPENLPEALQSLEKDSILKEILGMRLSQSYLGIMKEYQKLLERLGSEH